MKGTIALIAHDNKKKEIAEWAVANKSKLAKYELCGTGHTAKLPVKAYLSGPLGGDLEIGAKVADGEIGAVVFFWDPLQMQPHDPDVKALLRIAVVYDVPIATNKATADLIIGK